MLFCYKVSSSKVKTYSFSSNKNTETKVIHPKYSKHCPDTVAHTQLIVCAVKLYCHSKMLNHGLFLSLFKLIPCPIDWIVYVLAYLNFIFKFQSSFSPAQTHKSISFIWIVCSTLYVYLWPKPKATALLVTGNTTVCNRR